MFGKSAVAGRIAVLIAVTIAGPTGFFLLRYWAFPDWGNAELNIALIAWVVAIFVAERRLAKLLPLVSSGFAHVRTTNGTWTKL